MKAVLVFIGKTFNFNVLGLFIISSIFLLFVDSTNYKKMNYVRESRFCKITGYVYLILGFGLFIAAKFIK